MTSPGLTDSLSDSLVGSCVFPGLRPFEERDAALFFGRDEQVDALLQRLQDTRFLAIVGLSGSGKSSLVRAGLLPALRRGHVSGAGSCWRIGVMRPGGDPLGTLGCTLDDALGPQEGRAEVLRSGTFGLLDASRAGRGPHDNLLLVVDQFEEIFRVHREPRGRAEAAEFVQLLLAAVHECEDDYRVYVVLTMRSDYLGETALFPGLPEALNDSQYLVPRMTRSQLREAIEGPAALGGVEVEPELVDRLLDKTGEDPDELPVLQHLLMRMWQVRKQMSGSSLMKMAHLDRVGGWDDALTKHAASSHRRLTAPRQLLAKRIFQRLTEKGEASRESRRPTTVRELAAVAEVGEDEVKVVVEHFRREGRNFLTASDETTTGESVVDISHESLIRRWKDLRDWVDEEWDSAKWYERVEDASRLHADGKRGWLVNPELASALKAREEGRWNAAWAARHARASEGPAAASSTGLAAEYDRVMAFLENSRRAKRRRRAAKWLIGFASVLAVMILVQLRVDAVRTSRFGSLQGASAAPDPLDRALLLSELADVARDMDLRTYHAAAVAPIPLAVLRGQASAGAMVAAAFDVGDPARVAVVSADGTLTWWNSRDGRNGSAPFVIPGRTKGDDAQHAAPARQLTVASFSQDGRWVAAAFSDGSGWMGSTDRSSVPVRIPERDGAPFITALAFSPDARRIAVGYNDYQVLVWPVVSAGGALSVDSARGTVLGASNEGHSGPVTGAAFDPRGERLATSSVDRTIRIWRPDSPSRAERVLQVAGDEGDWPVRSVAFSPDGDWIVGAYENGVRLWRSSGGPPTTLPIESPREKVRVNGAWFSPDGSKIAAAFSDGRGQIWNVRVREGTGEPPSGTRVADRSLEAESTLVLGGHEASVRAASFSSDSRRIVTVSEDGTARVWPSEPGEPRTIGRHHERVESVAFSPDGAGVVAASGDHAAIWPVARSGGSYLLSGHSELMRGAAFSRDGKNAVVASQDGRWSLWRIPTADGDEPQRVLAVAGAPALSIAFDQSGNRVVTACRDGTAEVWDARSGRAMAILRGHADWVWSAVFSPDDLQILTASADKTARVWQADSGQQTSSLEGHQGRVLSAAFSPDGSRIVTASADRTARVWRKAGAGWVETTILRHAEQVNKAAFSPDGLWVVTSSDDGTARIWNVATGLERLALGHVAAVRAASFSPDGTYVVTGSDDGQVRLWRVTVKSLSEYLSGVSTACLDAVRRVRYLGESEKSAKSHYNACETRHGRATVAN